MTISTIAYICNMHKFTPLTINLLPKNLENWWGGVNLHSETLKTYDL